LELRLALFHHRLDALEDILRRDDVPEGGGLRLKGGVRGHVRRLVQDRLRETVRDGGGTREFGGELPRGGIERIVLYDLRDEADALRFVRRDARAQQDELLRARESEEFHDPRTAPRARDQPEVQFREPEL